MLAQVIDTSLLKCYLQTNEAMIAPLLRLDNNCHVEECERVLKKAKKYAELVSLYQNKGIHKKGTSFARKHLVLLIILSVVYFYHAHREKSEYLDLKIDDVLFVNITGHSD